MLFSEWLSENRTKREMTLVKLMLRSGVDAGTISYLENNHTEPTIQTAVLLASALDIPLTELYAALVEQDPPELLRSGQISSHNPLRQDILSVMDLAGFRTVLLRDLDTAYSVLSLLLELANMESERGRFLTRRRRLPYSRELPPLDIRWLLAPPVVYTAELRYPPLFADRLLEMYIQRGVFTFLDAGAYIRDRRRERKLSIAQLTSTLGMSASPLSRLEIGGTENIKLGDIFVLDRQLGMGGEIVGMYWSATCLYLALTGNGAYLDFDVALSLERAGDSGMLLVNSFIKLCRWLETSSDNHSWLDELRNLLATS